MAVRGLFIVGIIGLLVIVAAGLVIALALPGRRRTE